MTSRCTACIAFALAAICLLGAPEIATPQDGFDVAAEFITEQGHDGTDFVYCESGPRGQCPVTVRFQNVGDAPSPSVRVALRMWSGTRASGYAQRFGGSRAFETLPELQPGQYVDLTFTGRARGENTFRTSYTPALNDANNDNHNITKTFTLLTPPRAAAGGGTPAGSEAGFDVAAEFITETGFDGTDISYCESGPRGQCAITVRFENVGDAPSPSVRVALRMWRGTRASGYAQRFGGSRALETLPELQPGQYVDLTFTGRARGENTFRTSYTPALNDANNDNHDITKTITLVTQ